MLPIFRKIRRSLLIENRFSRYVLYAIGEIILVVIGILIALQINNWNESRKVAEFESEILMLIDQNLERDSILIKEELRKTELANRLTNAVLEDLDRGIYSDSINFWLGKIITFERFKSQSSGFEVLKSRGIEIVESKELQIALISYYDVDLFNLEQSLNDVINSFNADWIPVLKAEFSDFQWLVYAEPTNQKEFLEKSTTEIFLKLYQDNREGLVSKMNTALSKISLIRSLIHNSLLQNE